MKAMWKKQYLLKNLLFFLVPLMIPIILLGSFSILITQHFIKDDINQKNRSLLSQTRDNIELILNEMDTLALSYQTNHNISVRLKSILGSSKLTYEQRLELNLLNNFLGAPANARPYIHSIYVYYDNPERQILTSTEGIVQLDKFYDTDWYYSYMSAPPNDSWLMQRFINRYNIEDTRIITLYRKLYGAGSSKANGILVLNILPAYIENSLQDLTLSPEQTILVTDQSGSVLFQSGLPSAVEKTVLNRVLEDSGKQLSIMTNDQSYAVSHLQSERHDLHYISIIPQNVLYGVPDLLRQVTFALLAGSFLIGIFITFILTRRNYSNLKNIVSIITSAKQGKPIPMLKSRTTDEYSFILENMIKTFIEQSFLKTQLSARNYELRYMEMLALQSQINPHFLYNTLEIIYWKTLGLTGKPNDASKMIEHLSDILKYALDNPRETVILDKEIRYTYIYLEIQMIRNKDKFTVTWDVEERMRGLPVLKLILQPLIENSIYHGVKQKKGKCGVKIKVRQQAGNVSIRVIDNGKGMTRERLKQVREHLQEANMLPDESRYAAGNSHHIGLYNTNKRLKLSYGSLHGVRILSKPEWGTVAEITFPHAL